MCVTYTVTVGSTGTYRSIRSVGNVGNCIVVMMLISHYCLGFTSWWSDIWVAEAVITLSFEYTFSVIDFNYK